FLDLQVFRVIVFCHTSCILLIAEEQVSILYERHQLCHKGFGFLRVSIKTAFIQFSDLSEPAAIVKNNEFSCGQTIKKLIGATCLEYRSRSIRDINSICDVQYLFEPFLALIRKEGNVIDLLCF